MLPNQTPAFDASDNETNCCPRFKPGPWQDQELHFDNKLFVRASTVSAFHMPLNMGSVFARTIAAIEAAHAAGRDAGGVCEREGQTPRHDVLLLYDVCARHYGKNYVVAVAKVSPLEA